MTDKGDSWPEPPPFTFRLEKAIGPESVNAFAKRAGMAESTLRSYLTGRSKPGMAQLNKIAAAAEARGVSRSWLLTGIEGPSISSGDQHTMSEKAGRHGDGRSAGRRVKPPTRDEMARGTELDPDWPQVMEWVYDALLARKRDVKDMPSGRKLRDMVTAVLVLLRVEEGEISREKTRSTIDAIL